MTCGVCRRREKDGYPTMQCYCNTICAGRPLPHSAWIPPYTLLPCSERNIEEEDEEGRMWGKQHKQRHPPTLDQSLLSMETFTRKEKKSWTNLSHQLILLSPPLLSTRLSIAVYPCTLFTVTVTVTVPIYRLPSTVNRPLSTATVNVTIHRCVLTRLDQ